MKDERWKMKDERWKMNNERWLMIDDWWLIIKFIVCVKLLWLWSMMIIDDKIIVCKFYCVYEIIMIDDLWFIIYIANAFAGERLFIDEKWLIDEKNHCIWKNIDDW